jgi:chromosomal replication initiation ATPase DnaA
MATNVRDTRETDQGLRFDHHQNEIRSWLSAPDPSMNYIKALRSRHQGTGAWFIDGKAFANWKKQSKSFLWLHGNPGCGKTVLSSTIIEHLSNVATPDQVLLYFYFDFNDNNKQTLENMLRSLVNQLYQRQPDTRELLDDLRESFEEGYQQLSEQTLRDVLLAMLSKVDDVSIILDALDESSTITDLLAWLRSVLETQSIACRILVTARRQEDIESVLQHWMRPEDRINIHHSGMEEDIRAYIHHMVRNSEELERWQRVPEVQDEIETRLMEKSDGM